jgi:hypothetical protein
MTLSFQPIELSTRGPDCDGMLVLSDGRLIAVLSRLSDIHGALAGRWYVEAAFRDLPTTPEETFDSLVSLERRLAG